MKINKKFLPLKAHYFAFNAATAPVVPFIPTLIRQLGYSSVVLGTIYFVLPIIGLLAKPLFGAIADKFRKQKFLFLLFMLVTGLSFFSFIFIPPIKLESDVKLDCNNDIAHFKYCLTENSTFDQWQCQLDRISNINDSREMKCESKCKINSQHWEKLCKDWEIQEDCSIVKDEISFVADVPKKHVSTIANCLYLRIGKVKHENGNYTPLYCPINQNFLELTCKITCNDADVKSIIAPGISDKEAYGLYQFWLMFILLMVSWAGMAVVVSVGDAIAFEMLGDKPHLYGYQRLWGAIGWGTFAFLTGFLVDKLSEGKSDKDYTIVFFMALFIIFADILVSSQLKHTQGKLSKTMFKDLAFVFSSIRVLIFFFWLVLMGMFTALIWNFLLWHLEELGRSQQGCDYMQHMKTLQGLVMGIQCFLGEVPFFFLSGKILKKLGHVNTMTLILFAFGVRFLCYSFLSNPWFVLPIEIMNGVCFGLFYATMASYASIVSPPGTEATLQGLAGAIFEGIGVSSGSFIAGYSIKENGGSLTFRYFGIVAFIACLFHFVIQYILQERRPTHDKIDESYKEATSPSDGTIQLSL